MSALHFATGGYAFAWVENERLVHAALLQESCLDNKQLFGCACFFLNRVVGRFLRELFLTKQTPPPFCPQFYDRIKSFTLAFAVQPSLCTFLAIHIYIICFVIVSRKMIKGTAT